MVADALATLGARASADKVWPQNRNTPSPAQEELREREIKFIGLFGDRGHQGPYSPYKQCNHNLYIGIIIFRHIDNP